MSQQRWMHAYNAGSWALKNGKLIETKEEIPPFSLVAIGRAGESSATEDRDGTAVWLVSKPGPAAPLYRPEMLAVNGPVPIPYEGYGDVTQDWPVRVAAPLRKGLVPVHHTYGVAPGSWIAEANGGLFSCLGLDEVTARERGATKSATGKWSNLPKVGLVWIAPRENDHAWGQGWSQGQILLKKKTYDPADEVDDPMRFRLQLPYEATEDPEPLYTPINDGVVHLPTAKEDKELPVRDAVGWLRVRDAGAYLVSISAKLDVNGFWSANGEWSGGTAYIGLGLFGARPHPRIRDAYVAYRQPATMATRQPVRIIYDYNPTIFPLPGHHGNYIVPPKSGVYVNIPWFKPDTTDPYDDPYGDPADNMWSSEENVATSAVVELGAGWALGVLKIGLDAQKVEHFSFSIHRLGAASDVETYWKIVETDASTKIFWPADEEVT